MERTRINPIRKFFSNHDMILKYHTRQVGQWIKDKVERLEDKYRNDKTRNLNDKQGRNQINGGNH